MNGALMVTVLLCSVFAFPLLIYLLIF